MTSRTDPSDERGSRPQGPGEILIEVAEEGPKARKIVAQSEERCFQTTHRRAGYLKLKTEV